jgi:hypothetical protein
MENKNLKKIIKIKNYSYDVYYAFLKCIYIETEKAMDLLNLANNYKEENLKLKCIDFIKSRLTIENIWPLIWKKVISQTNTLYV